MKNINIDFLTQSYSDDDELMFQLLSIFNEMSNEFMILTDIAIKKIDFEEIEKQSHKFGSSCQMLGLTELFEQIKLCEENAITKSNIKVIEKTFLDINNGLLIVKKEIDTIINGLNVSQNGI